LRFGAALSSGLRSPSSGYASCCPRWRQSGMRIARRRAGPA
jgi:hypothetical protein